MTIHSLTKAPITRAQAETITRAAFGSAAHLATCEELTEGFFNAAYRLTLTDGAAYVLKVAPHDSVRVMRYEKNIMRAEVDAMRLIRSSVAAPVPEIHFDDFTRRVIDRDYFIMAHLNGTPFNKLRNDLPVADQQAIEREIGRLTRAMNTITRVTFGYSAGAEHFGNWRACFDFMVQGVLADGQDVQVELPLPYETLYRTISTYFTVLDEVTTPHLIHWDLWDGNIFVDPQNHHVTGLIDFERALWADPLMEVWWDNFGRDASHYIAGYEQNLLVTSSQRTRRILYNIYLYLIMVIECTYRGYADKGQENWARGKLTEELAALTR